MASGNWRRSTRAIPWSVSTPPSSTRDPAGEVLITGAVLDQGEGLVQDVDGLVAEASLAQADADVAEGGALIPAITEPLEDRGGLAEHGFRLLETAGALQVQAAVVQRVAGQVRRVEAVTGIVLRGPVPGGPGVLQVLHGGRLQVRLRRPSGRSPRPTRVPTPPRQSVALRAARRPGP